MTQNASLDGQGRVEDHWIHTELGGMSYLDTEPWRGEPLLAYLRSMIFWADVQVQAAEMTVLSLLGPKLADASIMAALGLDDLPASAMAVQLRQGSGTAIARRIPSRDSADELDVVTARSDSADWVTRLTTAGARPAGMWTYEAHRVAALRARLGLDIDDRTIPHEVGWIGPAGQGAVHLNKGCYRGQETVARVHNLGKPPRMLVLVHSDGSDARPVTGDPIQANRRTVGRVGTVIDHVDDGPIALALVKRGLSADTDLITAGEHEVAVKIDPESLPTADVAGPGRVAVEQLRGDSR